MIASTDEITHSTANTTAHVMIAVRLLEGLTGGITGPPKRSCGGRRRFNTRDRHPKGEKLFRRQPGVDAPADRRHTRRAPRGNVARGPMGPAPAAAKLPATKWYGQETGRFAPGRAPR